MLKHIENIAFLPARCAVFSLCFAILLAASSGVHARQDTPLDQLFTIRDIQIDETAASANRARQVGLLKAEEEAYQKLLRKLTQPDDRALLPDLSVAERQALISGIDFVEEQSSSRRYVARLDVRFEPGRVSALLASYSVPHVLGTGRAILVLHAHERGLARFLWERDETVEQARQSVDWVNRIRGYRFARGEIRERLAISASEVLDFNTVAALNVAGFNSLESVVMIRSGSVETPGGGKGVRYSYVATDSGVQGEGEVAITEAGETSALQAMYDDILEVIDSAWRERLLVDTGQQGELELVIPSRTLEILTEVEKKLAEVSLVQFYELRRIGVPLSTLYLRYTGREDQLALALRFEGLDMKPYGSQIMLELRQ